MENAWRRHSQTPIASIEVFILESCTVILGQQHVKRHSYIPNTDSDVVDKIGNEGMTCNTHVMVSS